MLHSRQKVRQIRYPTFCTLFFSKEDLYQVFLLKKDDQEKKNPNIV